MTNHCPACEAGVLVAFRDQETITYNGRSLRVENLEFSRCSVCGDELVLPHQAKANDLVFADAKREADGLWTSARIKEWRIKWRLSQQQAAKILGGGANAFSKYERGEVLQSRSMDLLMRVFDESEGARHYLALKSGQNILNEWKNVLVNDEKVHVRMRGGGAARASRKISAALQSFDRALTAGQWQDEQYVVDLDAAYGT
jgi:HTH-type transcriptional regulator/antitoxin MqsA